MSSAGRTPTTPRERVPTLSQRAGGPDEAFRDVRQAAAEPAGGRRPAGPGPARTRPARRGGTDSAPGLGAQPAARAAELTNAETAEVDGMTEVVRADRAGRLAEADLGAPRAPRDGAVDEPADEETEPGLDRTGAPDRARARALFARLVELPEGDPERGDIRDQLVRMHLPLVEYLARRFRNRGEPLDDLVQVATIGLIKSVDRFDPDRGVEFSTYATPTIVGEIKRHFRDKGWAIRVPRRLQELKLSLTKATSELSQSLGRSPTVAEIALHLEMTEEEVLEGLESANAYSAVSLDAPDSGDDEAPAVADTLGVQDESLEGVEYRESLKPLLEKLPAREKRILLLRFFGNMTQSQIATELGISQMHVSRLLARTLAQLRRGLLEDG
ncbi:MAG: SigB/SigF/SigG family RNA polymerase sigma factor [Frankia sp.]|nr:SigB/SigF/SigG family RNA polymerase sigma factor [Frankia sp.]